jgi:phytoene desaturase
MKKKVIVIGSGFGGLATAIRLANRGLDVELFEKRDRLGGRAYVYEINGFKFDGGPTLLTAPRMFDELFQEAGRRREDYFQFVAVNPFYRIFNPDGRTFDFSSDPDFMLSQIEQSNPSDKAGYQKLLAASRAMFEKGFLGLSDKPFLHVTDMLKIAPEVLSQQSYRPVYSYVAQFIQDEFLRQAFSCYPLLAGGNPLDTPSIYTLNYYLAQEWGCYSVLGGTGAIVAGLGKLFEELGGKIHLNAEVSEILVEGRKVTGVRLSDDSIRRADLIVSNADVAWTYKYLIPARLRRTMSDRRIERYQYSMSLFVIYFGTRRRYRDAGLAQHNIILGERYRDLLGDIFERKHLANDFALHLHIPTLTDPSLAPEDCEAFYVVSPVPHLGAGIDWTKMARLYRDRIMTFLEQNYLPDLQANIIAEHYIDPLHFQNTLNSYRGAAFSLAPTLGQSGWFRPHNRSEEFDNLYFTGAGTHPGAGLPGVLSSAKIVEKLIAAQ